MSENSVTPIIHVGNVKCKIDKLPATLAGYLSKELAVKVPNYWFSTKYKSGQWDGTQKFFVRPANTFPTGLLGRVINFLQENYDINPQIIDERPYGKDFILEEVPDDYKVCESKDSRDYQVDTMNKVITNQVAGLPFMRGVINIATNGGKTSIAEGLIQQLHPHLYGMGMVFLFVTHSKEIAYQAKKSMEDDLGLDIGFIGDGHWDIKTITVTIITTLYSRRSKPEFKELIPKIAGFVADECHHSSSNSWYQVLNMFENAPIRLGLTGTVNKDNPVNEMRLYSCTGEIVSKITNDYLIKKGISAKPVCILFTVTTPELGEETYQDAYALGIVESEERLDYIVQICEKETNSNNTVLILVEHINHGEIIQEELEKLNKKVFFTNGTLSSERRQELLDGLKNNEIDVLISSAILDEGVDVSNINAVIYARGMKSTRKLLQGIGRGLRKKEDGSVLRFYDFIDNMSEQLLKHSLNRYEVLKAEKFKIKALDIEDYNKMSWKEIES